MLSPYNRSKSDERKPLPPKLAALLRESWWLALVAVALYVVLVLVSYDKLDPAWSHSSPITEVHNLGGYVGAWLADILLYIFGISAYWWAVFFLFATWWGYKRIDSVS
ncbi:MAG: DNA translocase FtsK 4TM domain-containing protein, partial [Burkholderiales bacterium]